MLNPPASMDTAQLTATYGNASALPPDTFEVGLVLGGTVSAGAYTAGVLDFLIEALDAWTSLRDANDPTAPKHNLILKCITGTSGGAVCAAIAARALAYDFPSVSRQDLPPVGGTTGNPFYDIWVPLLDLHAMLDLSDIQRGDFKSVLNADVIDKGAGMIETYQGKTRSTVRSYIADPLQIITTLTNATGIPYQIDFGAAPGGAKMTQTYVDHADYARFSIVYPGRTITAPLPDAFVLGFGGARLPQGVDWGTISLYGRGSSAFPIGFPSRQLQRPMTHYCCRAAVVPSAGSAIPTLVPMVPAWSVIADTNGGQIPADYTFEVFDGGMTDNEPIELARRELAGMLGRNPRDGAGANRGVLLVDPFAGSETLGSIKPLNLTGSLKALLPAFIQQTRYDSSDLLLANDPSVFSRFMITAVRDTKIGNDAIASSGMDAFIGFACEEFRRHDYILGRVNCQAYLKQEFTLPAINPIFKNWTSAQRTAFGITSGGAQYLPLIPLMGTAAVPQSALPWPQGALNPEEFRPAIDARFKDLELTAISGLSLIARAAASVAANSTRGYVVDAMINAMNDYLGPAHL